MSSNFEQKTQRRANHQDLNGRNYIYRSKQLPIVGRLSFRDFKISIFFMVEPRRSRIFPSFIGQVKSVQQFQVDSVKKI